MEKLEEISDEFHLIVESGESEIFVHDEDIKKFKNLNINEILNLKSYTDEYYSKIEEIDELRNIKALNLRIFFI